MSDGQMNSQQCKDTWQRKYEVFNAALSVPAEHRPPLVRQLCGDDALLAEEVLSLLTAHAGGTPHRFDLPRHENEIPLLRPGQRLGPYLIREKIGAGGMGQVYLAERSEPFQQLVAVKIVPAHQATPTFLQRFHAERQALADLSHPLIVRLLDGGSTEEGHPYLVMEFVRGRNLAEHVGAFPMDPHQAARLARELADALTHAHQKGILHRDLKPHNILLDEGGRPRITDFGLAKNVHSNHDLTATGQAIGTPSYMAPEQAQGKVHEISSSTDLYGLGAVLYYLLTGRPPFVGPTLYDTMKQVVEHDPVAPSALQPSIPRNLEAICLKCLAKDPRRRYATSQELAADLDRFLTTPANIEFPRVLPAQTWSLLPPPSLPAIGLVEPERLPFRMTLIVGLLLAAQSIFLMISASHEFTHPRTLAPFWVLTAIGMFLALIGTLGRFLDQRSEGLFAFSGMVALGGLIFQVIVLAFSSYRGGGMWGYFSVSLVLVLFYVVLFVAWLLHRVARTDPFSGTGRTWRGMEEPRSLGFWARFRTVFQPTQRPTSLIEQRIVATVAALMGVLCLLAWFFYLRHFLFLALGPGLVIFGILSFCSGWFRLGYLALHRFCIVGVMAPVLMVMGWNGNSESTLMYFLLHLATIGLPFAIYLYYLQAGIGYPMPVRPNEVMLEESVTSS